MSDEEEHDAHGHGHGDGHGHAPAKKAAPAKGGAKGGSGGGIMGFLTGILGKIFAFLSESLRKFVAYSMVMFFLGTLFGYFIPALTVKLGISSTMLLVAPLILAALAYYSTLVAVIIFVLFLGVFLLFI